MRRGLLLLGVLAAALLPAAVLPVAAVPAADATVACRFADERLTEISGLAASVLHPGILWTHNDSSGGPYLYAVDTRTCAVRATLTLADTTARDFEAIATGRDAGGRAVIWVGDIGDNQGSWDYVRVHQVLEPDVLEDATVTDRTWRFTYADGPHDAETLLADPTRPRLWVVTKAVSGAGVYALPSLPDVDDGGTWTDPLVARRVAPAPSVVTDGSVSPDGRRVVLRGYVQARLYDALPPRTPVATWRLPVQVQGEAIAFASSGRWLWTAGEREDALWRVPLPAPSPSPSSSASPSPSTSAGPPASPAPAPSGGSSGIWRWVVAGLLGVGAVTLAAAASWRFRVG